MTTIRGKMAMVDSDRRQSIQSQQAAKGCYKFIGIKSHLHHFYDYGSNKPETDDDRASRYLLRPKRTKRCSPIVWKIILLFGINFLVLGAVLILVSHFTSRKDILQPLTEMKGYALVDQKAGRYNSVLDTLGTVGIITFVLAGTLIIVAVLLPTYCNDYCFEDRLIEPTASEAGAEAGLLSFTTSGESSPIERTVPVTQVIHEVQPVRRDSESALSSSTSYQKIG